MSWTKYFTPAKTFNNTTKSSGHNQTSVSNFSSYLPEVYAGHPNRIQRYSQFEEMDSDSDINAALDVIANFCTQSEGQADRPFAIASLMNQKMTEAESKIVTESLEKWIQINEFRSRLWEIFRQTLKYGDMFFVRDPETNEWLWLDQKAVEMIQVDNDRGKKPKAYFVRGFEYSEPEKYGASVADLSRYRTNGNLMASTSTLAVSPAFGDLAGQNRDPRSLRNNNQNELFAIESDNIVHLSLSHKMDINWPFGPSFLEPVYRVYKQKTLLEDAILIYRISRAPERRVFTIDVGDMGTAQARAYVESVKNDINQRRIPNNTGGGGSMVDAAYNPLSINNDYFFAVGSEGRGSKIDVLPGGQGLGDIDDLMMFSKKLARGLKVPPSYLPISDDQAATYNDGKVTASLVQEFGFNKFCLRIQATLAKVFDEEFKLFLSESGVMIDPSIFELRFNAPQNFTEYRQLELDQTRSQVYSNVRGINSLSERFKLNRYLGLTDEELLMNEQMWREENPDKVKAATGSTTADNTDDVDLSSVGVRGGDDFDMDMGGDFGGDDFDLDFGDDGGDAGGDAPAPEPAPE